MEIDNELRYIYKIKTLIIFRGVLKVKMTSFKMDGKAILIVFIGAIIAVTFLQTIGDSVFAQTNTATVTNVTVTAPAINATLDLTGRTLIGTGTIVNITNESSTSNGLIIQTGIGTSGLESVQLTLNDTASGFVGTLVNVSYNYEPDGYLQESSTRSVALLIIIFGALGILIFVIIVLIKEGSLGKLIRGESLTR